MYKKIMIVVAAYIAILLVIFGVQASRGVRLEYSIINMVEGSNLDGDKATCQEYHSEVISNTLILKDFLETCEITTSLDYEEEYFQQKVFIVYYYHGGVSKRPVKFYDYFWSTDNHEIINVTYHFDLFQEKTDLFQLYLIEIDKDDIISSEILFD